MINIMNLFSSFLTLYHKTIFYLHSSILIGIYKVVFFVKSIVLNALIYFLIHHNQIRLDSSIIIHLIYGSGESRILEEGDAFFSKGEMVIGKNHFLRSIRGSINSSFVCFGWEKKRKNTLEWRSDRFHRPFPKFATDIWKYILLH